MTAGPADVTDTDPVRDHGEEDTEATETVETAARKANEGALPPILCPGYGLYIDS